MLQGSLYSRYIRLLRTFFAFAVTLNFLVNFSAFPIRFCNPSGVSDIPTKLSANVNADTVSSPTVTPCFASSTTSITSSIGTLNRLCDSVHPCATPCKIYIYIIYVHTIYYLNIGRCFPVQHHSTSSTSRQIFHHSPHLSSDPNFPQLFPQAIPPYCVIDLYALRLERTTTLSAPRLSYLVLSIILPNVYMV